MLENQNFIFFHSMIHAQVNLSIWKYIEAPPAPNCCKQKPWAQEIWKPICVFWKNAPLQMLFLFQLQLQMYTESALKIKEFYLAKVLPGKDDKQSFP